MNRLTCGCGGLDYIHSVGDPKCYRTECLGHEEPIILPDGNYLVEGDIITECTLKEQRLYCKHEEGRWSRLKKPDSFNSIEA